MLNIKDEFKSFYFFQCYIEYFKTMHTAPLWRGQFNLNQVSMISLILLMKHLGYFYFEGRTEDMISGGGHLGSFSTILDLF